MKIDGLDSTIMYLGIFKEDKIVGLTIYDKLISEP